MFISKFMTKAVITLDGNADICEARKLMIQHRFRHIPVVRSDRTLLGIVSDRDVRSAMGINYFHDFGSAEMAAEPSTGVRISDIMTKDPVCVSLSSTIQDALLLIEKTRVGAFPVIDENRKVVGIVSDRDLLNAFIHVLGIKEPGSLLGIVVDRKLEAMEKIIHTLVAEKIAFGSILVYRNWSPDKWAVFPYLLTKNVAHLKHKLHEMGYELLDPIDWYVSQRT